MADGTRPRAVSGEIMTDPLDAAAGQAPARDDTVSGDIIDAEYITLPLQPQRGPKPQDPPSSVALPVAPMAGMDMLRQPREAAAPRKPAPGGPLFWVLGIGLAVAAFWVSGGHALVRGSPFLAAPHSALRISGVASRVDASGARPILLVDGEAANDGASADQLPSLGIAVTGNDGLVTRYRLGTAGRPIAPGEIFAFSSRLDVPKNGVKTVSVTFAE